MQRSLLLLLPLERLIALINWLIKDIDTPIAITKNQFQFTVAMLIERFTFAYPTMPFSFLWLHECPFAAFYAAPQLNVCWGFRNCINTKIIGSKSYLHTHMTRAGGKCKECEFTCEFLCSRFHCNSTGWYVINGKYVWFFMLICYNLSKMQFKVHFC